MEKKEKQYIKAKKIKNNKGGKRSKKGGMRKN